MQSDMNSYLQAYTSLIKLFVIGSCLVKLINWLLQGYNILNNLSIKGTLTHNWQELKKFLQDYSLKNILYGLQLFDLSLNQLNRISHKYLNMKLSAVKIQFLVDMFLIFYYLLNLYLLEQLNLLYSQFLIYFIQCIVLNLLFHITFFTVWLLFTKFILFFSFTHLIFTIALLDLLLLFFYPTLFIFVKS